MFIDTKNIVLVYRKLLRKQVLKIQLKVADKLTEENILSKCISIFKATEEKITIFLMNTELESFH